MWAAIFSPIEVVLMPPSGVGESEKTGKSSGFSFLELRWKEPKLHNVREDRDNVPIIEGTRGNRTAGGTGNSTNAVSPFLHGRGPEFGRGSRAKVDTQIDVSIEDLKIGPVRDIGHNVLAD